MCILVMASQGRNASLARKALNAADACLERHRNHTADGTTSPRVACRNSCNLLADSLMILQWGRGRLSSAQQAAELLVPRAPRLRQLPLFPWPVRIMIYTGALERVKVAVDQVVCLQRATHAAGVSEFSAVRRAMLYGHYDMVKSRLRCLTSCCQTTGFSSRPDCGEHGFSLHNRGSDVVYTNAHGAATPQEAICFNVKRTSCDICSKVSGDGEDAGPGTVGG
jgi:hypothetical protein